jgi:hypothetical protein
MVGLTKTTALDYVQPNIRINAVAQRSLKTMMTIDLAEVLLKVAKQMISQEQVGKVVNLNRWLQPSSGYVQM